MLDHLQLEILIAVAEEGTYTSAARRLHMTQPAVSRHMRLLQEQLGMRLFRRKGRHMLLTHAGERFLETARQILALSQRVEEEMAGLRGEMVDVLHLAGSGMLAWHLLAPFLAAFREGHAGVGFSLGPLPRREVGRAVREGRLDLVVAEEPFVEQGVESDLLIEMETVLVAPAEGRWRQRKRIYLRTLPKVSLILPARGTPARRFLEASLAERQVLLSTPLPALEVQDPAAALPLVAAGLGVALLPRFLAEVSPKPLHLIPLGPTVALHDHPFPGQSPKPLHLISLGPTFPWPLYLTHRAGPTGRAEELLLQLIRKEAPSFWA